MWECVTSQSFYIRKNKTHRTDKNNLTLTFSNQNLPPNTRAKQLNVPPKQRALLSVFVKSCGADVHVWRDLLGDPAVLRRAAALLVQESVEVCRLYAAAAPVLVPESGKRNNLRCVSFTFFVAHWFFVTALFPICPFSFLNLSVSVSCCVYTASCFVSSSPSSGQDSYAIRTLAAVNSSWRGQNIWHREVETCSSLFLTLHGRRGPQGGGCRPPGPCLAPGTPENTNMRINGLDFKTVLKLLNIQKLNSENVN